MKKTIKKLAALLLAGALAATAALPAMAEETGRTHTISNPGNADVSEHSYVAYQILKASSINNGEYGNIDWADNVSEDAKAAFLAVGPYADVEALVAGIQGNDSAKAVALADAAYAQRENLGASTPVTNGQTVLDLGLWVIVDTSNASDVEVVNWANLFSSDGTTAVAIRSKVDTVSSEKKVQDVNDSDENGLTGLQDSADYDIGDEIPYTITATLPANYSDYDSYFLEFQDDMSAGLTYKDGSAMIKYGDAEAVAIDNPTNRGDSSYEGGHLWNWTIADLKTAAPELVNGATVTITYKATLNEKAVIGATGNPNKMRIKYSNNPNNAGDGDMNNTPWDTNIVFTYKTVFNKVDGENHPLSGADFKLEKMVNGKWVDVTTLGTDAHPTKSAVDADTAKFEFSGLDDGDYKLTETQTPEGYNTIDPIEFTITAEHEVQSANPTLKTLTGTDGAEFTMTAVVADGSLTSDVVNESGSTLPSTGGMGTTIFYVIGGILVLAAAIILISKKRVQA